MEAETIGRQLLIDSLEGSGYRLLAAADGEEAVLVFEKHAQEISLVLSDYGLPKFSFEVVY